MGISRRLDFQPHRSGRVAPVVQRGHVGLPGLGVLDALRPGSSLSHRRHLRRTSAVATRARWLWFASGLIALLLLFPYYIGWLL